MTAMGDQGDNTENGGKKTVQSRQKQTGQEKYKQLKQDVKK